MKSEEFNHMIDKFKESTKSNTIHQLFPLNREERRDLLDSVIGRYYRYN